MDGHGFIVEEEENLKVDIYDASKKALSHCTIKQLLRAPLTDSDHNSMMVDGKLVKDVMLYGTVQSIDEQNIHTMVMLHDYSGVLPIKFWGSLDNESVRNKLENLKCVFLGFF